MDIQCAVCKSTFLKTTRAPQYVFHSTRLRHSHIRDTKSPRDIDPREKEEGRGRGEEPVLTVLSRLTEHASNKHSKTLADCFPGYEAA